MAFQHVHASYKNSNVARAHAYKKCVSAISARSNVSSLWVFNLILCYFVYRQMSFAYLNRNGTCVGASVYFSPAESPAFLLKDYDSTEYSTWTESQ